MADDGRYHEGIHGGDAIDRGPGIASRIPYGAATPHAPNSSSTPGVFVIW
jgi:hypothetical protein